MYVPFLSITYHTCDCLLVMKTIQTKQRVENSKRSGSFAKYLLMDFILCFYKMFPIWNCSSSTYLWLFFTLHFLCNIRLDYCISLVFIICFRLNVMKAYKKVLIPWLERGIFLQTGNISEICDGCRNTFGVNLSMSIHSHQCSGALSLLLGEEAVVWKFTENKYKVNIINANLIAQIPRSNCVWCWEGGKLGLANLQTCKKPGAHFSLLILASLGLTNGCCAAWGLWNILQTADIPSCPNTVCIPKKQRQVAQSWFNHRPSTCNASSNSESFCWLG